MEYFFTDRAEKDFQAIYRYIARENPKAARQVIAKIESTCESLTAMPGMGNHPAYVTESSVMVFPVQKYSDYLVFYSEVSDGLLILRILHAALDLPVAFYK